MTDLLAALLLGIIEGITEFLPISSTGHLLIAEHWLGHRSDLFNIAIQAGAILAVVLIYRQRLWELAMASAACRARRARDAGAGARLRAQARARRSWSPRCWAGGQEAGLRAAGNGHAGRVGAGAGRRLDARGRTFAARRAAALGERSDDHLDGGGAGRHGAGRRRACFPARRARRRRSSSRCCSAPPIARRRPSSRSWSASRRCSRRPRYELLRRLQARRRRPARTGPRWRSRSSPRR